MSTDEPPIEEQYEDELNDAVDALLKARGCFDAEERQNGAHALEKCREILANIIRDIDGGEEHAPMWELASDDVEDYVGCELVDVAFSGLGSAAVLVFEREDGSLHGFKLTPRENICVCDVEVQG